MSLRLQTSLLLSMIVHLGFFALAGSIAVPTYIEGGQIQTTGGVVMAELVAPPDSATAPPKMKTSRESSPPDREEPPVPPETEIAPTPKTALATEDAPSRKGVPGNRLNIDFARMAWVQQVVVKTQKYQRNAPKEFEGMVRSALSLHPSSAEGSAKISLKLDRSGTVSGVDIRSDSPELKTALRRVGWESGPLPARYQIPCAELNVNVTVTGPNLSVGVEIL